MRQRSLTDLLAQQNEILTDVRAALTLPPPEKLAEIYPRRTYYLAAGDDLHDDLGWLAQTLTISNYSNQWYYIPSEVLWLPPYTINQRLALSTAVQSLEIINEAPPGYTLATVLTGQLIIITADSQRSLPVAGISAIPGGHGTSQVELLQATATAGSAMQNLTDTYLPASGVYVLSTVVFTTDATTTAGQVVMQATLTSTHLAVAQAESETTKLLAESASVTATLDGGDNVALYASNADTVDHSVQVAFFFTRYDV